MNSAKDHKKSSNVELISPLSFVSKHVGEASSLNEADKDATSTDSNDEETEYIEELMFEIDGLHVVEGADDSISREMELQGTNQMSPSHSWVFDVLSRRKLLEHKAADNLRKSATFLSPSLGISDSYCSTTNSSYSPSTKSSILSHSNSFSPKSALRGSYEELGLGPRPKLNVTWAPDVYEPACSSVSRIQRSTTHKHRSSKKKGKSSHSESCKRHDKKGKSGRSEPCNKKHDKKSPRTPATFSVGWHDKNPYHSMMLHRDALNESKAGMADGVSSL